MPPDSSIECDIELKEVEPIDEDALTVSERLKLGYVLDVFILIKTEKKYALCLDYEIIKIFRNFSGAEEGGSAYI